MIANNPKDIDEYIACFPEDIRVRLTQVRVTILKAAPQAEEVISYGMPAYKQQGILVWFAAHKKHIGFYPKASAITEFKKELLTYKTSKGSVQFPLNEQLPIELVTKIVKYRLKDNEEKAQSRVKPK